LRRQKIVSQSADGGLRLQRCDLDAATLDEIMAAYHDKRGQDREGLERMVFYAQTGQCRWRVVLDHLEGQAPFEHCGHCDNCRRIAAHEAVLNHLAAQQPDGPQEPAEHADEPHFARGDIVKVKRYGRGIVDEASALQVTVAFADGTRRVFQPDYVAHERRPRPRTATAHAASRPVAQATATATATATV
jgi:ATP-dependent DNA helicase RecQ